MNPRVRAGQEASRAARYENARTVVAQDSDRRVRPFAQHPRFKRLGYGRTSRLAQPRGPGRHRFARNGADGLALEDWLVAEEATFQMISE
jgi:hypothetical protein